MPLGGLNSALDTLPPFQFNAAKTCPLESPHCKNCGDQRFPSPMRHVFETTISPVSSIIIPFPCAYFPCVSHCIYPSRRPAAPFISAHIYSHRNQTNNYYRDSLFHASLSTHAFLLFFLQWVECATGLQNFLYPLPRYPA